MGCGVSKDDIAEPRTMQSHGREKVQLTGENRALKPISVTSVLDPATCISSLYISSSVINNPGSPPSVFIHTSDSLSSEDESDLESSYEFPSNLSIEEVEENVPTTTALSDEKTRSNKGDVEERVEAILAADKVLSIEHSQQCSTCPLSMLSGAAVFQALMSTVPVITQQNLAGDFSQARVDRVAVISGSKPIYSEIIDLDEEPGVGEVLILENTHEKQADQSDQEHEPPEPAEPVVPDHEQEKFDQESASSLTEQPKQQELQLDGAVDTHKTLSGPESRKAKLPPLTIVPPILLETPEIPFVRPFGKPALPIVVKKDLLEVKIPAVVETEQFEDLTALESANGDNHDTSKSSPVTEPCETPTPATKSPTDSEWRSLHSDTPDPDIEDIVLLESQELATGCLDNLPLMPLLDYHGIHMDKKDLISSSLRLIS